MCDVAHSRPHGAFLADAHRPVLWLVEGPAWTGKSRLARELYAAVADDRPGSALLLRFTAYGVLRTEPATPPDVTPPDVTPPGAAAERLAESLRAARPALLVVEDAQLADPACLDVLRDLAEHPPPGLAMVLTYRPEELPVPGLVWRRAARYPAELAVRRHLLTPLELADTRRLVTETVGAERCGPGFVTRLHTLAGGVPQVVRDVLRELPAPPDTRHRYGPDDLADAPVPVRLAELVLGRTAELDADGQRLVRAAAVLGTPATTAELARVAGLEPEPGAAALSAALRRAVLGETAHRAHQYAFPVPLGAPALLRQLPGPEREALHTRAAETLARRQPVPWVAVAAHWRRAHRMRAWSRAVRQAAEEQVAAGDIEAAIGLLSRTVSVPELPQAARGRLALLLARSAVDGLRSDRTMRVLRELVEDVELPPGLRGEVRLDLGLLQYTQAGRCLEGRDELHLAIEELAARPQLAARAMAALGMPSWPGAPLAENLSWLRRAVRTAEQSGDGIARLAAHVNWVAARLDCGEPHAERIARELPRTGEDVPARRHVARGLCNAAESAVWRGNFTLADELLADGLELAIRTGTGFVVRCGESVQLLSDWMTGRWQGLDERARSFEDDTHDMPTLAGFARVVLGALQLAEGRWDEPGSCLAGPEVVPPDATPVHVMALAAAVRTRHALARDEVPRAVAEADAAWTRIRAKGVWVWAAELAPWAVRAHLATGAHGEAAALTAEFARGLDGRESPLAAAALTWCEALVAVAESRDSDAVESFTRAGQAYAALPRPYEHALLREDHGRLLATTTEPATDPAPGVELLKAVAEELAALGARWDAARVRGVLRTYRPDEETRRRVGRPGYGDQLTPREREVVELVAMGLSNREVGATLFLSPRTVEQHVRRAMRKAGVRSRLGLRNLTLPADDPLPAESPS